jgi:MraZ protein
MMFTGEYSQKLDDKARLILPKPLRHPLSGADIEKGFYVTRGFEGCVLFRLREEWEALAEEVSTLNPMVEDERKFQRMFFASSTPIKLDSQSRFIVPDGLQRLAKIKKDVLFVGVGSVIEIWAKSVYENYEGEVAGEFGELAQKIFAGNGSAALPDEVLPADDSES